MDTNQFGGCRISSHEVLKSLGIGRMKKYTIEYYFSENYLEIYAFVCMANSIEHAVEQCVNDYPNANIISISTSK